MSKNITILPMLSQGESNHINTCRVAKCSIIISRKLLMFPLKGNFKLIWALLWIEFVDTFCFPTVAIIQSSFCLLSLCWRDSWDTTAEEAAVELSPACKIVTIVCRQAQHIHPWSAGEGGRPPPSPSRSAAVTVSSNPWYLAALLVWYIALHALHYNITTSLFCSWLKYTILPRDWGQYDWENYWGAVPSYSHWMHPWKAWALSPEKPKPKVTYSLVTLGWP